MELVDIGDGHRLAPAPAASYRRMRAAGCPAGITSSYRSNAEQQRLHAAYLAGRGAFALPAGSSEHERGYALDLWWAAAQWVRAHPEHGWRFTNPDEWWHVDYVLVLDIAATRVTPPDPLEDDDMTPEQARQLDELHGRLVRSGYVDTRLSHMRDAILEPLAGVARLLDELHGRVVRTGYLDTKLSAARDELLRAIETIKER